MFYPCHCEAAKRPRQSTCRVARMDRHAADAARDDV